jgi:hypothetical protein
MADTASTPTPQVTLPHTGTGAAVGGFCPNQPMNQNLQQPFYQATGYEPSLLASGIPYGG